MTAAALALQVRGRRGALRHAAQRSAVEHVADRVGVRARRARHGAAFQADGLRLVRAADVGSRAGRARALVAAIARSPRETGEARRATGGSCGAVAVPGAARTQRPVAGSNAEPLLGATAARLGPATDATVLVWRATFAGAARRIQVHARSLETTLPGGAVRARWRSRAAKPVTAPRSDAGRARIAAGAAVRLRIAGLTVAPLVTTPRAVAGVAAGPAHAVDAAGRSTGLTLNPVHATGEGAASDDAGLTNAAASTGVRSAPGRDTAPELTREVGAGVARHAAEPARPRLVAVLTDSCDVAATRAGARTAARGRHARVAARNDEAVPGHVRNAGDWGSPIGRERVATPATAPASVAEEEECVEHQQPAERTHGPNRLLPWALWSTPLKP